ncbi:MAG: hypothetical protein LBR61_02085 [Synergistaceae bacterium]|jgi:tetratricopeptide (TPR) repeat protein|nr:hypothetical protein [Synergistaceae bacterium]
MREEDVYELLDRACESEDASEMAALVDRALELDPDNPEALLFKADLMEDEEGKLPVLERALAEAERYLQEEGLSGNDILEDETGQVYLALLQRLAYLLFFMERDDEAMERVEEFLRYDSEEQESVKDLYYCILLEREEWSKVLETAMQDSERTLGWAYARVIASFMLLNGKNPDSLCKMLWEAVRMSPNVPFYMMGYIPDPVDESEEESEDFHFAVLFENVLSLSRDFLNWFSCATILFGLLSNRFGEEREDMEEILDALGGKADYEEISRQLPGGLDDRTIVDALITGGYPHTSAKKDVKKSGRRRPEK